MEMIRVAGYCRVSTDRDDQANSFDSQRRFFREYINRQPNWLLHDIYADEGITGTSTKDRIRFNQMIDDAYAGKFALILTKEVSRFSRNILDTIRYTRELKALGVGVVFMTDGISTLEPDAELRLSIMGSIAQEESRKTSTRVKWGQTRQMERGVVFGHSLLGYKVRDGKMILQPDQAEIIRRIFFEYGCRGRSTSQIAQELQREGIRTGSGSDVWRSSGVVKILRNEKYVGDLVQKKTVTVDYLTHRKTYNRGEEEMICIRDHHEPIISRELWNAVQSRLSSQVRRQGAHGTSRQYPLSGKVRCLRCRKCCVARTSVRKDGSRYQAWYCCGTQVGEKLLLQTVKIALERLPLDDKQMNRLLCTIVTQARKANGAEPLDLQREIRMLMEEKPDTFCAGMVQELGVDPGKEIRLRLRHWPQEFVFRLIK